MRISKFSKLAAMTGLALLGVASGSQAATISYNVTGTNAGLAVDATVTFTTSLNQILVTVVNNIVDPKGVAQNVSAVAFVLSTGQTSATITNQSNQPTRTIASDGTYTTGTITSQWGTSTPSLLAGGITLCVIGNGTNSCSESASNASQTVVGQPNSSNVYGNANNSITGNTAHNPFLYGPVSFTLSAPGVTAASTVTRVLMNFGTELGGFVTPPDRNVPEPGTLALLGLGLLGLGASRRRLTV